jgi:hypothetical protein
MSSSKCNQDVEFRPPKSSLWSYKLFPFLWAGLFSTYYGNLSYSANGSFWLSLLISYLPTYIESFQASKQDGLCLPQVQRWKLWKWFQRYFQASVNVEERLNHKKQYIFCCFPHGPVSANHMLTMTDSCGMLTEVYQGTRRDLAASILFVIPFVKDVC